mgnify:CR=1 FL=1
MFTLEPPFEGSPLEIMKKIEEEMPKPPSEVNPDLPEEVDEIVMKALSKDPDERYELAAYMRDDLRELV